MEDRVKKFLVLYLSSASAADQMARATPEQAKAGMQAWMTWSTKAGAAIVDLGQPVGGSMTLPDTGARRDGRYVGGFSILQAASTMALKDVLKDHPHFMAPDGAIEVHEFLPMPGM